MAYVKAINFRRTAPDRIEVLYSDNERKIRALVEVAGMGEQLSMAQKIEAVDKALRLMAEATEFMEAEQVRVRQG